MNLKDIGAGALQVLKTVAPALAATALGPFTPLAAPILQKIFGTTDAKSTEAALLTATPEQIIALKQADIAHEEFLTTAGITREQLAYSDVASARNMNIQTKDPTLRQLAWLNVGGFLALSVFLVVAAILWPDQVAKVPATAWTTIGGVFGYLAKSATGTENFYFGGTASGQSKDATIADIAKS